MFDEIFIIRRSFWDNYEKKLIAFLRKNFANFRVSVLKNQNISIKIFDYQCMVHRDFKWFLDSIGGNQAWEQIKY